MQFNYLKQEKNEAEIEMDNATVAEILRVYLNQDSSVEFAAWRRDHPFKNLTLKVKTSGKTVDKALKEAVAKIGKELDSIASEVKKAK